MISKAVLQQADALSTSFDTATPFRHAVIDGFFDESLCRAMLADFPRFDDRYARNEMGDVGGKAVRTGVRELSSVYRDIDDYLQTPAFLDFVSKVTGIPELLYDPDYVGGGTHENRDGQGLDQHVDFNFHPATRWHRRLNLIVYLNPEWDGAWGGNLQLQTDPWNGDVRGPTIVPLFNRAVIFETTERSWHGFDTIHLPDDRKELSRKSFAIYLYTKQRPSAETAAPHATVYVPEGMPATLVEGSTLSATDIDDLRARFTALRGQLKFLYEREKHFEQQIAAAEGALEQAMQALRVPLQGYATQASAPRGLWPDGWVGADFQFELIPTRKTRRLDVVLWIPPNLATDQEFEIAINDRQWRHHAARGTASTISLDVAHAAGESMAIRIRAVQTFVPNRDGHSTDDRALAWRLTGVVLDHK